MNELAIIGAAAAGVIVGATITVVAIAFFTDKIVSDLGKAVQATKQLSDLSFDNVVGIKARLDAIAAKEQAIDAMIERMRARIDAYEWDAQGNVVGRKQA